MNRHPLDGNAIAADAHYDRAECPHCCNTGERDCPECHGHPTPKTTCPECGGVDVIPCDCEQMARDEAEGRSNWLLEQKRNNEMEES